MTPELIRLLEEELLRAGRARQSHVAKRQDLSRKLTLIATRRRDCFEAESMSFVAPTLSALDAKEHALKSELDRVAAAETQSRPSKMNAFARLEVARRLMHEHQKHERTRGRRRASADLLARYLCDQNVLDSVSNLGLGDLE